MASTENYRNLVRQERFTRLAAAHRAAERNEMYNSARLFENKLQLLGAWRDDEGCWRLDSAAATGSSSQPY